MGVGLTGGGDLVAHAADALGVHALLGVRALDLVVVEALAVVPARPVRLDLAAGGAGHTRAFDQGLATVIPFLPPSNYKARPS